MKRKSFAALLGEFFGYLILGFILSYIVMGAMVFAVNTLVKILVLICTMGVMLGLLSFVAFKEGKRERSLVKLRRVEGPMHYRCLICGLILIIPLYTTVILLALSKAGIVGDFYGYYKLFNPWYLPLTAALSPMIEVEGGLSPSAYVADIGWGVIGLYALLPISVPLVIHLTYKFTFNEVAIGGSSNKNEYQRYDD